MQEPGTSGFRCKTMVVQAIIGGDDHVERDDGRSRRSMHGRGQR
jgi:hypothetical protein